MRFMSLFIFIAAFSSLTFANNNDPMGLSDYVIQEKDRQGVIHVRRMTNHEANMARAAGLILGDGSVKQNPQDDGYGVQNAISLKPQAKVNTQAPNPQHSAFMKDHKDKKAIAHFSPDTHQIIKKPKPSAKEIAKITKTKHPDDKGSRGTIHVRPVNFPANPSRDEIVRMQRHIQHIERTVGKALDLSLSAYAVAELPQATEGRSSVSIGLSSADGKAGAAVGYSSNFGDKHEYTVKISLSHAGHSDAVGAGFGWQW